MESPPRRRGRPRKASGSGSGSAGYRPKPDSEIYALSERPLFAGIKEEWEAGRFSDVRIRCEGGDEIRAHKIVLATISHMFRRALLADPTVDEDSVIIIPDVGAEVLAQFLENVYVSSYEDVRINAELDYLGFADQMIDFTLPDPLEMKAEPTVFAEPFPSQNYITNPAPAVVESYISDDDDDDVFRPPKRRRRTLVDRSRPRTAEDEATVREREKAILEERDADPDGPAKRVPKPSKSNIWNFFRASSTKGLATCHECAKKIKNTSGATTTLRRHLEKMHPSLYEELVAMDKTAKNIEDLDTAEGNENESRALDDEQLKEDNEGVDDSDIKPGSGRGKRSAVWKHFTLDKAGLEENQVLCKLCERPFTASQCATTNLVRHLEAKHPEAYEEFRSAVEERRKQVQERDEELTKNAVISVETVDGR